MAAAELSDRQRRAVEALLSSKTVCEAATKTGIGERTIRRWQTDATFRDAYRAASRERLSEALGRLRSAASAAVTALQESLSADAPGVRVRAAQVLLDSAIKAEVDDLERRVQALEEAARRHG
jgi:hypothetical protein